MLDLCGSISQVILSCRNLSASYGDWHLTFHINPLIPRRLANAVRIYIPLLSLTLHYLTVVYNFCKYSRMSY